MADVADEECSAGGEEFEGLSDDVEEVVGVGEVLHDGVEDDGVEVVLLEVAVFVCGLGAEGDFFGEVGGRLLCGVVGFR